jgi:hypothetical protein
VVRSASTIILLLALSTLGLAQRPSGWVTFGIATPGAAWIPAARYCRPYLPYDLRQHEWREAEELREHQWRERRTCQLHPFRGRCRTLAAHGRWEWERLRQHEIWERQRRGW